MQKTKQLTLTLLLLLTAPLITYAQVGAKKYITKSKDTTIVVMNQSGLKSDASAFLREKGADDSDRNSRYEILRDAVYETNRLTDNIGELERKLNMADNAMEFERSKRNIERNKIEKEIERLERKKMLYMDTSDDEKAFLEQKFGNKPSYFLNGMPVDEKIISYISDKEILSRSLKVSNTVTGNPNGEIWYVVSNKTLQKFGISSEEKMIEREEEPQKEYQAKGEYFQQSQQESSKPAFHNYERPNTTKASSSSEAAPKQKNYSPEQQAEINALKKQINAVRAQQGLPPLSDSDFSSSPINLQESKQPSKSPTSTEKERDVEDLREQINSLRIQRGLEPLPNTPIQVKGETDNNSSLSLPKRNQQEQRNTQPIKKSTAQPTQASKIKAKDETITSFDDSPLQQAKNQEEVKQQESSPKRSVRKIKERDRER